MITDDILSLLSDVLVGAKISITSTSNYSLSPWYRREIYIKILTFPKGQKIIGWLAVFAAENVMSICESRSPRSDLQNMLTLARSTLEGRAPIGTLTQKVSEMWHSFYEPDLKDTETNTSKIESGKFDTLMEQWDYSEGFPYFGELMLQRVLSEVSGIEPLMYVDEDTTDEDLFSWIPDTAMWASTIYAGPVWIKNSNLTRRLNFWIWWLNEAIPKAWYMTITEKPD